MRSLRPVQPRAPGCRRRRRRRSPRKSAVDTPGPGRSPQVRGLRVHLEQPGGLHPAQPQAGGGPEVDGGQLVPGESVEDPVCRPGAVEGRRPTRSSSPAKTSNDVDSGARVEVGAVPGAGPTSGCASRARPDRAASAAARLAASTTSPTDRAESAEAADAATVPAAPSTNATTNQDSVLVSPLVVTVLLAQRTLASVPDCTTTTQPSVRGGGQTRVDDLLRGEHDPCSAAGHAAPSCTGVEDRDPAEPGGGAAVRHRRDLPGLALAAVERAAEQVGLRAADGVHRPPEVGRGRLVGDIPAPGRPAHRP